MRRAFLRLILACLLLAAQQAALTHATWHAQDRLAGQSRQDRAASDRPDGSSTQGQLCGFDLAFGQVLGGAHGSGCDICLPELAPERTVLSPRPYSAAIALSFHSRAPPVLL